jgi:hypothetical protein
MSGVMNQGGNTAYHAPEGACRQVVDDVYARANAQGETLAEQVNSAITNTNSLLGRYVDNVRKDERHYSAEGLDAQLGQFANTQAAKDVDEYERRFDAHVDQLAANLEAAKRALTPNLDTAGELRASRAWDRHRQALSAKEGTGQLAHAAAQAVQNASTPEERNVLLQELPSFLESHGVPSGFLDQATAQVAPELAEAQAKLAKGQRAQMRIKHNARAVRQAIDNHRPAHPGVLVGLGDDDPDRM